MASVVWQMLSKNRNSDTIRTDKEKSEKDNPLEVKIGEGFF
jgi:hypothetical protein